MTFLPAATWNEMAEGELETPAARVAFLLSAEQLPVMEDKWAALEREAGTSERVSRCLLTCLPLLAEVDAVSSYLENRPELRNAMPEITSPADAVSLMRMEWRLNPKESDELKAALESPDSLERWRKAAELAKAA